MGTTVVGALFSPRARTACTSATSATAAATASAAARSSSSRAITRSSTTTSSRCPSSPRSSGASCPKNVITRALGMQDQVVVDLQHDEPQPGDVYLLCSDGLSGMIGDDEILDIVMSTRRHPRGVPQAHRARERARRRGQHHRGRGAHRRRHGRSRRAFGAAVDRASRCPGPGHGIAGFRPQAAG